MISWFVLNAVGTFGMGSASYWWSRLFSILARCGISITGRAYLWQLLFADDLNIISKRIRREIVSFSRRISSGRFGHPFYLEQDVRGDCVHLGGVRA